MIGLAHKAGRVEIGEEPEDVSDGADRPVDNTAAGESTEPELIYSESAG